MTKFRCQQKHLVTSFLCCKFLKKISLNVCYDFIHIYSPRAGADSPPGDKVLMSTSILIVNVRPLSGCLLLFNLLRIALWPSVGKEVSHWPSFACAVFNRLNCRNPFPVWCLGQDVEFDCIGS